MNFDASTVTTMPEVRSAIDCLDRQIVELIATRVRFIEAAARIKTNRDMVRDEARKADVLTKVVNQASESGAPHALVEQLYEVMVEWCIAHEFVCFDAKNAQNPELAF